MQITTTAYTEKTASSLYTGEVAADVDDVKIASTADTKKAEVASDESNVQSGDLSNIMFYVITAIATMAAFARTVVYNKKHRA